jgi:hypothetical protein
MIIVECFVNETYLECVVIPKSHNLHGLITDKLQNYKYLKERLIRIWQLTSVCTILLVLCSAGINPNKLDERLKL